MIGHLQRLSGCQVCSTPSVEEEETPTSIVVYSPTTLTVAVQPLDSSNITRSQFIDQFLKFAYGSPSRYRIIGTSNTTLENMDAEQIVMYEYPETGSTAKVMRTIALANDTAYSIKYTAEPNFAQDITNNIIVK